MTAAQGLSWSSMSKAFVKDDALTDQEVSFEPLELDKKYYLTPKGYERLQMDLESLQREAREDTNKTSSLKKRIQYLEQLLHRCEVLDPVAVGGNRIRFGATVSVEDENGESHIYRIVGIQEADSKVGKVSYISPIAKALLGHREGDIVTVKTPHGDEELEIRKIEFIPVD